MAQVSGNPAPSASFLTGKSLQKLRRAGQTMGMIKRIAPVILLLSACAQAPQLTPPAPPVGEDTCNAAQYGGLVGQDATALERVLLMGPVRVIRPGMAVTMDYSATRINFAIDDANRISAITCG
jgi:Peptidase inhibitor I78 family